MSLAFLRAKSFKVVAADSRWIPFRQTRSVSAYRLQYLCKEFTGEMGWSGMDLETNWRCDRWRATTVHRCDTDPEKEEDARPFSAPGKQPCEGQAPTDAFDCFSFSQLVYSACGFRRSTRCDNCNACNLHQVERFKWQRSSEYALSKVMCIMELQVQLVEVQPRTCRRGRLTLSCQCCSLPCRSTI